MTKSRERRPTVLDKADSIQPENGLFGVGILGRGGAKKRFVKSFSVRTFARPSCADVRRAAGKAVA
jgi:hypothetical protein